MIILGIWDGHDAGAALIRDGEIVFAANEERFTRKKLDVEFPSLSIREALKFAAIRPEDVTCVAISTSDFAKTLTRVFPGLKRRYYLIRRRKIAPSFLNGIGKKAKYALTEIGPSRMTRWISSRAVEKSLSKLGFGQVKGRAFAAEADPRAKPGALTRDANTRLSAEEADPQTKPGAPAAVELVWVEHHLAHAAAAVGTSPYEKGLFLSLDGIGDGLSGMIGTFAGAKLEVLKRFSGKDSLGLFFEHVTNLLNMRELEDEGKVMALAGFGYPVPDDENPLMAWFETDGFDIRSKYHSWKLHEKLGKILALYPSEQFAYMAQRVLEANIVKLVESACRATGLSDVVYAGGVASNIKVNMLLKNSAAVKNLYVFPHMGDGGLALGAAVFAGQTRQGIPRYPLGDLFLGPEYSSAEVEEEIRKSGLSYRKMERIEDTVADLIRDGQIVLWFQGRMEYGPRALGHRSILALPGSLALKNKLNIYLKKRVWYQPFCPTMLADAAAEMLDDDDRVGNPFMTVGYRVKDRYADRLAAVIGADNSCRPQILAGDTSRYGRLLEKVKDLTGFGVVLNTSMNKHGEAIINSPREALALLAGSRFEYLAIEDFLVWKK
jgi:carbamoyltransferase